jgi:HlyD family secretion protein
MNYELTAKMYRVYRYCIWSLISIALVIFSTGCSQLSRAEPENTPPTTTKIPRSNNVVALGRLEPKGEVIKLSVANAQDSRVNEILVAEGDFVKVNQVIAILQGIDRSQQNLKEAEKSVEFYQAKLEQTQLGEAKAAELAAQKANIESLDAQLRNETLERQAAIASAEAQLRQAKLTFERNQMLQIEGATTQQELDRALEQLDTTAANVAQRKAELNNTVQTLQKTIDREKENLSTLQEVRPVDVRVAQIELERAKVALDRAKAELEDTKVRVPISGQILRINTNVGESVNLDEGIVEIGQTDQMYAIAEVYETDITKVKLGQKATIKSEYGGFAGEIHGTVERISLQIGSKTLEESDSDPTTDNNLRVVEVKIKIDPEDSRKVASLTNMQVRIGIEVD